MVVAREAGVSQATVSMILNKKYNVSFSKETIRQVTEAGRKAGLSPAKTADPPVGKEQKTSGCVLPDTDKPLLCHAAAGHRSHGKRIRVRRVCLQHPEGLKIEENYLRMMREVQPLGIIYACNPSFSRQVAELSGEIPVVVISNRDDEFSIDAVALNNQKPGILMARHLLELGHRDVAFIAPPLTARQHQRRNVWVVS